MLKKKVISKKHAKKEKTLDTIAAPSINFPWSQ